jgi:hypothetical protein
MDFVPLILYSSQFLFPIAVPSAVPDLADGHIDIDGDAGGGGLRQVVVVRLCTQFNIRFPIFQYIFSLLIYLHKRRSTVCEICTNGRYCTIG